MRAGWLNRKIVIQNTTVTQDAYGEPVPFWEDFAANRWARVEPLAGREFFAAQQTVSRIDTKFTLRYIKGVKPAMRVVYNGENYDIAAAINVNDENRELNLMCTRVTT